MKAFATLLAVASMCLGCVELVAADKPAEKVAAKLEIRRAEKDPADGLTEATIVGSKVKVYLHQTIEITNADIAAARAAEDGSGKPALEIMLTKEGATKLRRITEAHKDRPLAILVDGKVLAAPTVKAAIGEVAWITGNFTREEVESLARSIKAK
jgi:preprotein translocase subunit SecD